MNAIVSLLLTTLVVTQPIELYNFKEKATVDSWTIVNDGVMGGLSSSKIVLTPKHTALFSGKVRTENNGGFASVRYRMKQVDTQAFKQIIFKVKGDGKRYQIRVKKNASDYFSYIQYIQTSDQWQEITIDLKDLYPSFRGVQLPQPNYSPSTLEEIAILIGNKKEESFALEIESIALK